MRIFNQQPVLISGPCSAESEEQVMQVARELSSAGIHLFRAGIWKPRSRPDSFQGMGETALKWLQQVKNEYNLPVAVEVANPYHIEQSLKAGIDVLWIGARTTVNPFIVQEIAEALKGVKIPVMIKNPVTPDLDLWIGALERVEKADVQQVIPIHRGFSTYKKSRYRNSPMWEIPIELKRRCRQWPLVCDPSHISGRKELIRSVSQNALDLGFEGLMIEVHHDPANALSDQSQQLNPDEFKKLLSQLTFRHKTTENISFLSSLEELREHIDDLDEEILTLLQERMKVVEKIGRFKKENDITIYQPERWDEIIETRSASGMKKSLAKNMILKLLELIHQESISRQKEVMDRKGKVL